MDVSNGRLKNVTENADYTKTFHWYVENPINNYGVNINIGDYVHLSGGGYVGCWEVTNTGTSPSFTNITAKFTNCDCI